jgi:hypothetical protein
VPQPEATRTATSRRKRAIVLQLVDPPPPSVIRRPSVTLIYLPCKPLSREAGTGVPVRSQHVGFITYLLSRRHWRKGRPVTYPNHQGC